MEALLVGALIISIAGFAGAFAIFASIVFTRNKNNAFQSMSAGGSDSYRENSLYQESHKPVKQNIKMGA